MEVIGEVGGDRLGGWVACGGIEVPTDPIWIMEGKSWHQNMRRLGRRIRFFAKSLREIPGLDVVTWQCAGIPS